MSERKGVWEGLGGPVHINNSNLGTIDATLESCCARDERNNRLADSFRQTLRRHDIVAERERRRRNLVSVDCFEGCRCAFDPNSDGGGYRALIQLREERRCELRVEPRNGTRSDEEAEPESVGSDDEYDYLLDESLEGQDDDLLLLEERRRAEIELMVLEREVAQQHGYGVHRQSHPARALKLAGLKPGCSNPPPAVVLHLFDPDSRASASLDLYLEFIASSFAKGTMFLRSGGRSTLLLDSNLARKVLPRLDPERDIPALVAIRDGAVVNTCPSLKGLVDNFSGQVDLDRVEKWLWECSVLLEQIPRLELLCGIRPEESALLDNMGGHEAVSVMEDCFRCGVTGCSKSFPHEHVGIATEYQTGLVVGEHSVLDENHE